MFHGIGGGALPGPLWQFWFGLVLGMLLLLKISAAADTRCLLGEAEVPRLRLGTHVHDCTYLCTLWAVFE